MSGKSEISHDQTTRKNTWLMDYSKNVTSQHGEDGIIEKILEIIGEADKWCVEFGSWDGMFCSNTYRLIKDKGYSAILIEGSAKRFKVLLENFKSNDNVNCLNRFVGFEKKNSLDTIFAETNIPKNFDLLSIDIDGNDYHVWDAMNQYQPKVVVIEFNPTISKTVEFIQPKDMSISQGSSCLSLTKLAKDKGYELVCCTTGNAIYVDRKYFPKFGIENNDVETMIKDESLITHMFCGYDGTVFLRGYGRSPWQQIPFKEKNVQFLPKWARRRFGEKNFIKLSLGKKYRRFLRRDNQPEQV